jgi:hypothetical protein
VGSVTPSRAALGLSARGAVALCVSSKKKVSMSKGRIRPSAWSLATRAAVEPLTVGQEWSGYATQLLDAVARVEAEATLSGLDRLAAGSTAVCAGLNAPGGFGRAIAGGRLGPT